MKLADIETFLLALPAATLSVQWGNDRVFKVGGKMFAVIGFHTDKTPGGISFKASSESFRILTELPGIKPAPYLARAEWVWLDKPTRLTGNELKAYLTRAHTLVAAGLTKKLRAEMGLTGPAPPAKTIEKKTKATPKPKGKRKKHDRPPHVPDQRGRADRSVEAGCRRHR